MMGDVISAASWSSRTRVLRGFMSEQVYVAEPGYMLSRVSVPKQAILTHLAGAPLPRPDHSRTGACPHGTYSKHPCTARSSSWRGRGYTWTLCMQLPTMNGCV